MADKNYMQLRIPVENADLVFEALTWRFGITPDVDEEGNQVDTDKETLARRALIAVTESAVIEYRNMKAIEEAQASQPDLGIN